MLREIRLAVRGLRCWRLGAATAVITLAVGIGTATSMYAFLHAALSKLPDIADIELLGRIYASSRALAIERSSLSLDDVSTLTSASSFDEVAAHAPGEHDVVAGSRTDTMVIGEVSPRFFAVFAARAAAGRLPSDAELREHAPVVVVSDGFWRTHFPGRAFDGGAILVDGAPRTIVGVLPPEFSFPFIGVGADVWAPLSATDAMKQRVSVVARLKRGVTWGAAQAELAALARPRNASGLWTWTAIPVQDDVRKRTGGGVALMFGPALVVLLIGCTNVACMLLARGIDREMELSVRRALGATRARIVRQLLVENVVLAAAGGALGFWLARGLLRAIAAEMSGFQPEFAARMTDGPAILPAAVGFSIVACVLFGTLPALRLSARDITAPLKGATATASGRVAGYGARDLVVFVELGLAVALVVTAALWLKFFAELQVVRPLFPADQVVAAEIAGADAPLVRERIRSVAGIDGTALATQLPGGRRAAGAAQVRAANGRTTRVSVVGIGLSFFETIGLPVLKGRSFDPTETHPRAGVVVVSQSAAGLLWPDEDPIGASLTIEGRGGTIRATVVGVARDSMDLGALLRSGLAAADIYTPIDLAEATDVLVLARARHDARALVKPVASAARLSPGARLPRVAVVADDASVLHPDSVFIIRLIGGFALVALALAATGIFGVIGQSVAQRTTEFGVRMAMGASSGQVLRMVVGREARLILAAVVTGALVTLGIVRSTFVELLTISGTDPRLWLWVMALCGGVAAVAVTLATWRIVKLDPWEVLRQG